MNIPVAFVLVTLSWLCFGRTAFAETLVTVSEAESYISAIKSNLEAKTPYDIRLKLETSYETDEQIAPTALMHCRIRTRPENDDFQILINRRFLPLETVLSGTLGRWNTQAIARHVSNELLREWSPPSRRINRQFHSTEALREAVPTPDVSIWAFSDATQFLDHPRAAREKPLRILSLSPKLHQSTIQFEGRTAKQLTASIHTDDVVETHRWVFLPSSLEALLYEVSQAGKIQPPRVVYRQKLVWEEHAQFGSVPIEIHITTPAKIEATRPDGTTEILMGRQFNDFTIEWLHYDKNDFELPLNGFLSDAQFSKLLGIEE